MDLLTASIITIISTSYISEAQGLSKHFPIYKNVVLHARDKIDPISDKKIETPYPIVQPLTRPLVAEAAPGLRFHEKGHRDSGHRILDRTSEKNIATLHENVALFARTLVLAAEDKGIKIRIISGLRTYEEQDALYEIGRTMPGKKVTDAKGGHSNHNFGIAFDVGVFDGDKYLQESPSYNIIGEIARETGLEWGGNWLKRDRPHYQLRPTWAKNMSEPAMLKELRNRVANKKGIYAD
jgi:peptidoglycan L-alanyl-D-glutamate endopeptidase CwlK